MLSYIFRLINQFQPQPGIEPTLIYMNEMHMLELRKALSPDETIQSITDLLGMEMIIHREITHPQVVWVQTAQRIAV